MSQESHFFLVLHVNINTWHKWQYRNNSSPHEHAVELNQMGDWAKRFHLSTHTSSFPLPFRFETLLIWIAFLWAVTVLMERLRDNNHNAITIIPNMCQNVFDFCRVKWSEELSYYPYPFNMPENVQNHFFSRSMEWLLFEAIECVQWIWSVLA